MKSRGHALVASVVALILAAGCSSGPPTAEEMEEMQELMMTRPEAAPEMQNLARFIGTWSGESTMDMPEGMPMPASAGEEPPEAPSFTGQTTFTWALDGRFLKGEGWFDLGEGKQTKYVEYITWNPEKQKYHMWFFTDWGQTAEGWWTPLEDADGMAVEGVSLDARGNRSHSWGEWRFVDDRTVEFSNEEEGPHGRMKMSGTSKKIR